MIPASSSPSPRGRPRTLGLRERILRAAEDVFAQRDFHEVLVDDIARTCGVGKGTLYRYFPGKHELFMAIMFEGMEQLRRELETAVAAPGNPVSKIERIVRCTLAHFWNRSFLLALIHRNEHRANAHDMGEWLRRRDELASIVTRTLDAAISAGHLRPVDPRIATEMLIGMLRGVNRYRSPRDKLDDMVTAVVGTFLSGVGTTAGRRLAASRGDIQRMWVESANGHRQADAGNKV